MPNVEINDIALKAVPSGTDEAEIQETGGGDSKKIILSSLSSLFAALTGNQSIAGVKTFSDTTDATSKTAAGTIISGGLAIAKKMFVGDEVDIEAGAMADVVANVQTGTTYAPVLSDAGKLVTLNNAAAITLTIPANSSVAFRVGTVINLLSLGAGIVTIGITTDTLVSKDSAFDLTGQYSAGTLVKTGTTTWVLFGDLA